MADNILSVQDLRVSFLTYAGEVQAVRGVSFDIERGETLGIVGESGCGKSVTAQTIMKLNPAPPSVIKSGSILLDGADIVPMSEREMQRIRGAQVSMIFQDPMTCLNPTMQIGKQVAESIVLHQRKSKHEAHQEAIELLDLVRIPNPAVRAKQYPHQFSGGMRQRAMIAMGLACKPKLLIADEPTTALDVTIQAQILDLIRGLREQTGTAVILITHDLGVVAEMCDRVAVMYAGEIVEQADTVTLFRQPLHPYTRGLIDSIPVVGDVRERLAVIPGNVPNLIDLPAACRFAPRCVTRELEHVPHCNEVHPGLLAATLDHEVRCWLYHDEEGRTIRTEAPASFRRTP
jgi:oligopeptide transport system ATP-binding protein